MILSGEGAQAGPLRLDAALAAARERAFGGLAEDAEFVVDSTDDLAWAEVQPASSWASCSARRSTVQSTWRRSPGASRGPWPGGTDR